ncbi:MAG: primosomal protein N' [Gemmataceae bacterium]
MIPSTQPSLFGPTAADAPAPAQMFADVVFDRPLDHAYTYAVPDHLLGDIAVGKRVWVPFGRGDKATVGYCVHLNPQGPNRVVKEVLRVLDEEALLSDHLMRLTRWMADYYLCGWGQVLNAVLPAGARAKSGTRAVVLVEAVPEAELPQPAPALTAKQTAALRQLRQGDKPLEPKRLARLARCGLAPVSALVEKGFARRVVQRVERGLLAEEPAPAEAPITLNADQLRAWGPIEQAIRQGGFHAFLLHGVTGSGKTEIYLRAIEETIQQGKEAMVLVPEISLTPQTIQRFRGRCREVAVLHSHLGEAERGAHWRRIAAGQVQVIVGARSAVFAPTRKLGLIVIDEEHETSFKQDSTPRYHGRDVAVMRARLENVPILLGSATPALESWHNCQRGQYTLLTLPQRVLDRPLPKVGLIDLRHEVWPSGRHQAISPSLEQAMYSALGQGGQVMLLLNRRGFSTYLHCPGCGHVIFCRFCDLAMTYHRQRDLLLCHHCGYEQEPPQLCTQCGQVPVLYHGHGTEKLQAEIEAKFPQHVVRRMDSDTMRKPGSHGQVLNAFRRGEIHILLGTQMIAKGLDFPNVMLVGVINADVALHWPDFRSAERTFQLLSQVAGRAGRGPNGGKVLIQTFNPEHPCITLAAAHDYAGFVAQELAHRQAHNYPPYQRLARLVVRSRDAEAARTCADRLSDAFALGLSALTASGEAPPLRLLGPAEAPVFRLKGYYRYHFQLQSPSAGLLHQLLRRVLPTVRPPSNVEWTLDIDPLNML